MRRGAKKWPHYLDDGSERGFLSEWLFQWPPPFVHCLLVHFRMVAVLYFSRALLLQYLLVRHCSIFQRQVSSGRLDVVVFSSGRLDSPARHLLPISDQSHTLHTRHTIFYAFHTILYSAYYFILCILFYTLYTIFCTLHTFLYSTYYFLHSSYYLILCILYKLY